MGFRHGLEVSAFAPLGNARASSDNSRRSYALQWLFILPLEIVAATITLEYWNGNLPKAFFVTVFLLGIMAINMMGVRGYGEAEFIFSIIKVIAVIGFM